MTPPRVVAIDVVKGIAILAVLGVHANVLAGTPARLLLDHAVPVFVVLFGVNGALWWRRHDAGVTRWYASRAWRILPPVWATVVVWWLLVAALRPTWVRLSAWLLPLHLVGVLTPEVGTGWFVAVIVQLVVLFPLLHALARPPGRAVAVGLAVTCASVALRPLLVARWGAPNAMLFGPRFLLHVAFGIWLADRLGRVGVGATLAAVVAAAGCVAVRNGPAGAVLGPYVNLLEDLPLTVALLGAAGGLARRAPSLAAPLAWLGVRSWGLYLGQLLAHNAYAFRFGLGSPFRAAHPWAYAGFLLAAALGFRAAGELARSVTGSARVDDFSAAA